LPSERRTFSLHARCRHNSAFRRASDGDGLAAQVRIVALFDRRVEGININMDDLAIALLRIGLVHARITEKPARQVAAQP
jgi:hypothetical protein